jgi:hypothetical protein
LPCMKVNADIYCLHSASSQSPVKESREFTTRGGRRLLHNITTNNFTCLTLFGANSHAKSSFEEASMESGCLNLRKL